MASGCRLVSADSLRRAPAEEENAVSRNELSRAAFPRGPSQPWSIIVPTPAELEQEFWKELKSDMTVMLGIVDAQESHTRPMTAQIEGEGGPIWFFTASDTSIARDVGSGKRAIMTFAAKDHELFAAVHGKLVTDNDRATIDRLWSPFIAAWFEGGKDDPKLTLLRLDPDDAQIWENGSSLFAGIKLMFGADPKKAYRDKVASVDLRH
jgi:general stress protein 26